MMTMIAVLYWSVQTFVGMTAACFKQANLSDGTCWMITTTELKQGSRTFEDDRDS